MFYVFYVFFFYFDAVKNINVSKKGINSLLHRYIFDMMDSKILSFVFLAILLLFPASLAVDYGVAVDITPKAIDTKPCGIAAYDIEVTNMGELEDTYSFDIEGVPEGWFTLSHDTITLKAGETQKVYLFITPDCYEEEYGLFEGTFIVTDGAGDSTDFTLNVIPDHILELEIPETLKVCLGEDSEMTVVVRNVGEHTEEVYLTASGDAGDFTSFPEESFTLEPDKEKEVMITVSPVGVEYGNYGLIVEAKSTTSYARTSVESIIEVTKCYDVEVTYPEEVKACGGEAKAFEITIKNIGLKNDTYTLTIEDLEYEMTVSLAPEEFRRIELEFFKEEEGTYEIPFTVASDVVTKEGMITFVVEKCYGVDLILEVSEIDIESGRGGLVKGTVKNTGVLTDTFNIISDVIWSIVKPDRITLESEQEENVYAYYSPEYGVTGTQTVELTAKSAKSEDTEELTIEILPKEEVPTTTTTTPPEETTTTVPPEETTTTPEEETTTAPPETTTTPEEETTTTTLMPGIPTGRILDIIYENRAIRSLLIAIIVVIIILIIIYLIVMR